MACFMQVDEDCLDQDWTNEDYKAFPLSTGTQSALNSEGSSTCCLSSELSESSLSERDASDSRKLGRKTHPETIFLRSFQTVRGNRPPKKENLRIQLFRGMVKLIDSLQAGKSLSQRINYCYETEDLGYRDALEKLKAHIATWESAVNKALEVYRKPKLSGKASYNDDFFRNAFGFPAMRLCYEFYVDFLFCNKGDAVMRRRLALQTSWQPKTGESVHLSGWDALQGYCRQQLFHGCFDTLWSQSNLS